jgi:hypothetical protein
MWILFFSRVSVLIASATEEVGTSRITSTPSWSYQRRAMVAPTSGLFWWSPEMTSALMPFSAALKSSIAMRVASTEPSPVMSA